MKPAAATVRHLLTPLALAAALTTTASAQILIQPLTEAASKDSKIYSSIPNNSLQSDLNVVSADVGADFRSLVQFDLSSVASLPAAGITSAVLTLYSPGLGISGGPANGGTVSVSPMLTAWRENAADPGTAPLSTYNNFFGATPTLAFGSAVATQTITGAGFYSWDITGLVRSWQDGSVVNNGLFIQLATPGGDVGFADVDSSPNVLGSSPSLTVVPEPSTTAALAAGGLALGLVLRRRSQGALV